MHVLNAVAEATARLKFEYVQDGQRRLYGCYPMLGKRVFTVLWSTDERVAFVALTGSLFDRFPQFEEPTDEEISATQAQAASFDPDLLDHRLYTIWQGYRVHLERVNDVAGRAVVERWFHTSLMLIQARLQLLN